MILNKMGFEIGLSNYSHQWGHQQDFSKSGSYNDITGNYNYLIVADGHGRGDIISTMQSPEFPWTDILIQESSHNMMKVLLNLLIARGVLQNSCYDGTTLSIVKIYENFIRIFWIGDSQVKIFNDNNLIFASEQHNCLNENEIRNNSHLKFKSTTGFKLINKNTIKNCHSKKVILEN